MSDESPHPEEAGAIHAEVSAEVYIIGCEIVPTPGAPAVRCVATVSAGGAIRFTDCFTYRATA